MIVRVSGASRLPPSARRPGLIRAACLRALKAEGARGRGEVNVVILDRRRMRELNRRFLSHDHDTDVIAFPYEPLPAAESAPPLGDIFVSAHMARLQARRLGHPVLAEVLTLVVHGTLHLMGWRDDTPRRRAAMFRRQDRLLRGKVPAARR